MKNVYEQKERQEAMIHLVQAVVAGELDWDALEYELSLLFFQPQYVLPKGIDLDLGPLRIKTSDEHPTKCDIVEIGGAKCGWCRSLTIILEAGEPPRFQIEGLVKMLPPFPKEEPSTNANDHQEETTV